jgi:hypothetical protein
MSLLKGYSSNDHSRNDYDCRSNDFCNNDNDNHNNYYGGDHYHTNVYSSNCYRINDYRMEDNPSNRYCSNNYHSYGHRNNIYRSNDLGNGECRGEEYRSNELSRSGSANRHGNQGRDQSSSSEDDNYFGNGHCAVNPAPSTRAISRNTSSPVEPNLGSYNQTLREGGWNGMLHFMGSRGLDMCNPDEYQEGRTILDAYIHRDQQTWEQGDEQERQDRGIRQVFDFNDGEALGLHLTWRTSKGRTKREPKMTRKP